jgi:hypothetical protein
MQKLLEKFALWILRDRIRVFEKSVVISREQIDSGEFSLDHTKANLMHEIIREMRKEGYVRVHHTAQMLQDTFEVRVETRSL